MHSAYTNITWDATLSTMKKLVIDAKATSGDKDGKYRYNK
jgi:hypothetical protein